MHNLLNYLTKELSYESTQLSRPWRQLLRICVYLGITGLIHLTIALSISYRIFVYQWHYQIISLDLLFFSLFMYLFVILLHLSFTQKGNQLYSSFLLEIEHRIQKHKETRLSRDKVRILNSFLLISHKRWMVISMLSFSFVFCLGHTWNRFGSETDQVYYKKAEMLEKIRAAQAKGPLMQAISQEELLASLRREIFDDELKIQQLESSVYDQFQLYLNVRTIENHLRLLISKIQKGKSLAHLRQLLRKWGSPPEIKSGLISLQKSSFKKKGGDALLDQLLKNYEQKLLKIRKILHQGSKKIKQLKGKLHQKKEKLRKMKARKHFKKVLDPTHHISRQRPY